MQVDWFISVRDEETGVHRYRGGAGFDRESVIEQVIQAGREIACRGDGSVVGVVDKVVIGGTPVHAIVFGDPGVSDEELRYEIGLQFDRVRSSTGFRPDSR
ncbi:hypothetical protein ACIGKR_32260 [Rhodococcus qingshengii]|uniref:hypothetical protein n=1 Tax=Rhodococcus TaxID=1827 RepID=UPI0023E29BA3|nr:hypothetical protein [Rhodococcus sp. C3V]MDF3319720.1 hypothetical protein [Rhodococcus sp. C3V]